jgi:hypothetical protein
MFLHMFGCAVFLLLCIIGLLVGQYDEIYFMLAARYAEKDKENKNG